jgi:hypothetical protein
MKKGITMYVCFITGTFNKRLLESQLYTHTHTNTHTHKYFYKDVCPTFPTSSLPQIHNDYFRDDNISGKKEIFQLLLVII